MATLFLNLIEKKDSLYKWSLALGTIFYLNARKLLLQNTNYRANLSVDLDNLFNNKCEMSWQFQDPGFNAIAKVEFTF